MAVSPPIVNVLPSVRYKSYASVVRFWKFSLRLILILVISTFGVKTISLLSVVLRPLNHALSDVKLSAASVVIVPLLVPSTLTPQPVKLKI